MEKEPSNISQAVRAISVGLSLLLPFGPTEVQAKKVLNNIYAEQQTDDQSVLFSRLMRKFSDWESLRAAEKLLPIIQMKIENAQNEVYKLEDQLKEISDPRLKQSQQDELDHKNAYLATVKQDEVNLKAYIAHMSVKTGREPKPSKLDYPQVK